MRILVIEDDHAIAFAIKKGLEQETFAVDLEYNGEDGYSAAAHGEYDLVVLDVMLPGISGIEIARKLRENANQTRILMLSAKDQTQDRIRGLNAGADDYLVKPFSFEELLARIRALLRRPGEKKAEILEAGDLSLNTITREIYRNNEQIKLSAKEFAILEYLLRNKGRVLSKHNIINHVWDLDAEILPHTVEVFIAFLREKVDKPFTGAPLIQTVRGFGYKIGDTS